MHKTWSKLYMRSMCVTNLDNMHAGVDCFKERCGALLDLYLLNVAVILPYLSVCALLRCNLVLRVALKRVVPRLLTVSRCPL